MVYFVSFQALFNELPIAQVVLPDAQNTTVAVRFERPRGQPPGRAVGTDGRSGGVMAAIPLVIVFLITQRSLVTGLTSGSVKG